uniref:H or Na translocating Ftype putative n=1 Tax=Albugo laibachii Nc14 TaxID=890382 RepID=F0VZB2_9STRA|nr:H or Na translocating Ftype putative [Albugo laibachii Nc14]|eukprot:CCA14142.1 H or Na translocating Ftype putative [Albugo laibachii Nc14]
MSSTKGTSLWRVAGVSYLQYTNKSACILRDLLKEPLKSKLAPRNRVEFAGFKWSDGERGTRVDIKSISEIAKAFKAKAEA